MKIESVPGVVRLVRQTLGARVNVRETTQWMRQHRFAVTALVGDLDHAVRTFNGEPFTENAQELKEQYPKLVLPTASELITRWSAFPALWTPRAALSVAERRMERGERPEKIEPYLAFHQRNCDHEARVVAGGFHLLPLCASALGLIDDCHHDKLVDALIEAAPRESILMDAVASPHRLDWIRESDVFDPELREWVEGQEFPPAPSTFPWEPSHVSRRALHPREIVRLVTELEKIENSEENEAMGYASRCEQLDEQLQIWGRLSFINAWLERYDPTAGLISQIETRWLSGKI